MSTENIVVQTLRHMGLTRAEAETYLAMVLQGESRPVSAYHVAQAMGKDPANLSKTLNALERVGAVRTVQEKPRLFLTIFPEEFTANLLSSMKEQRLRVLDEFKDLQPTRPQGIPMALSTPTKALEKTGQLLSQCRDELLIFAAREVISQLGTSLDALAASSEVVVKLLSSPGQTVPGIEVRNVSVNRTFGTDEPAPWLQVILDRQTWLMARIPRGGTGSGPVGWWCHDPDIASMLGASLLAAWEGGMDFMEAKELERGASSLPDGHEEATKPVPEAPSHVEEELTFLIQHENDDGNNL